MNILMISHFFPPHKGGVETATYNTAKSLVKLGHNVFILTSKYKKNSLNVEKLDGFLIYRFRAFNIPEIKIFPQISSFGFMPQAVFKLPKLVKELNIHIIHIEGRLFPISILSALMNLIILKRPMVITIQGRLNIGITAIFENIFDRIFTRFLYQKFKKIICVSKSLKQRFLNFKIVQDKLIVIPNGVDTSFFTKIKPSRFLDSYIPNKKNYKKILFVGRLDAQKGVEYLLRSIPLVLEKFEKVHFFILGNGKLEKKLKKLAETLNIQNYVNFIDMIPYFKMPEVYASADIFCLPSIHEGFPLSIAEALSIGLVIVASSTEGIPEAIKENENGFLIEPKNIIQLAEKLIIALNLEDIEIQKIYHNNIKLAKNNYSWKGITKQIISIYKE